jgi:hypothetical protein
MSTQIGNNLNPPNGTKRICGRKNINIDSGIHMVRSTGKESEIPMIDTISSNEPVLLNERLMRRAIPEKTTTIMMNTGIQKKVSHR